MVDSPGDDTAVLPWPADFMSGPPVANRANGSSRPIVTCVLGVLVLTGAVIAGRYVERDLARRAAHRAAWARVGHCDAVGDSDIVECEGVELEMLALPPSFAACAVLDPCRAPVNVEAAPAFRAAVAEIDRRGLGGLVTRFETVNRRRCKDALTAEYIDGCISKHSFGIAADVREFDDNASWPAVVAREPGVLDLINVFQAHGFRWGGDFRSNFDPQHVEWEPR